MSESSVFVSSPEEDVVISSSSSSRSGRVSTSSSKVGTSNPQLLRPLSSEPLRPSSSQPPQPSTSQPSPSLPAKNALGDVKDQAEDEANPKPWYTVDEKSSKMSTEDLVELLWEYPLPVGWYARLPSLQEPANYGTKYETGIYEEQVRSGYRLPLHPFAHRFFEHYHMAPSQLVPNGWRKLVGLIYLVQTSGYKPDATNFMRATTSERGAKSNKGWHSRYFFVGCSDKGKLPFDREWNPYCKDFENPGKPTPNNLTKHILSHIKLRGGLSIDEPLSEQQLEWARIIPRMPVPAGAVTPPPAPTISSTFPAERASLEMASGSGKMPQGGFLGILQKAKGKRKEKQPSAELPPASKKTRLYASGFEMLSRFEMARQVAAEEAQQIREALKEAKEATRRVEELSKQETNYLAQIETLERRLERANRRVAEEVKKARDQGIRDFLDGNAGMNGSRSARMTALRFMSSASRRPWKYWGFDKVWALIPLKKKCLALRQDATAFSRRDFILPGGLLFTENANLDVGRRPRRNAVYFTDSSKLSIYKVAALNHPRKHAKDSFFSCTMFSRLAEFFLQERLLTKCF
ncbi:hypothetical protein RJ639_046304 [Escallonia herrerae]|uniref:Transposase (putative) gypsy type domain-containing protein n=1 Tax=Escallonia herrerae TaxID=1293975 RepID=A0AA88WA40_9ASTE|nr:hypothetical protein RJ639_046304 [Escallonia herrerae]